MPSERLDAWFADREKRGGEITAAFEWWVRDTYRSARAIADGDITYSELAVFWIRLGGVLIDVDGRLGRATWEGVKSLHPRIGMGRRAARREVVVVALEQLRQQFTESELVYIEHRRNAHAHPFLDGYELKVSAKDSWDQFKSKFLGVVRLGDLRTKLEEVRQNLGGEAHAAAALAKRSVSALGYVRDAVVNLFAS